MSEEFDNSDELENKSKPKSKSKIKSKTVVRKKKYLVTMVADSWFQYQYDENNTAWKPKTKEYLDIKVGDEVEL